MHAIKLPNHLPYKSSLAPDFGTADELGKLLERRKQRYAKLLSCQCRICVWWARNRLHKQRVLARTHAHIRIMERMLETMTMTSDNVTAAMLVNDNYVLDYTLTPFQANTQLWVCKLLRSAQKQQLAA